MNISAGTGVPVFATTVTRDAAFGGAGEKVLAEGQLCYLSASNIVQYYDGAAWATVGPASAGALTLISTTTIGTTVASVTVSSAFSSTYENYQIVVSGGIGSTGIDLQLTFGATITGYYSQLIYATYNNTIAVAGSTNTTKFSYGGSAYSGGLAMNCFVGSPNLAKTTTVSNSITSDGFAGNHNGTLQNSTQYTAFTITANTGTITGGTIYVYGFAKA
jgi:hypothetical protein